MYLHLSGRYIFTTKLIKEVRPPHDASGHKVLLAFVHYQINLLIVTNLTSTISISRQVSALEYSYGFHFSNKCQTVPGRPYACSQCILWHFVMLSQLTGAIKERDSWRQQTLPFSRPLMERLSIRKRIVWNGVRCLERFVGVLYKLEVQKCERWPFVFYVSISLHSLVFQDNVRTLNQVPSRKYV